MPQVVSSFGYHLKTFCQDITEWNKTEAFNESHLRRCICTLQTESLCCVSLNVLLRHTFFTGVHLCVQVRWTFPFRKFVQSCAWLNHHLIMYPFVMVHFPICFNCSLAGTALMPSKMVGWHVNRPNLSKLTLTFIHSSQYGYRLQTLEIASRQEQTAQHQLPKNLKTKHVLKKAL